MYYTGKVVTDATAMQLFHRVTEFWTILEVECLYSRLFIPLRDQTLSLVNY